MSLEILKAELEAVPGLSLSDRGAAKARFLYVTSACRAIEAAEIAKGIWIEYWDDTDKAEEKLVREETVSSCDEAFHKVRVWLAGGTS
jgi:hypothetical protein